MKLSYFIKEKVKSLVRFILMNLGINLRKNKSDRKVLENIIFPELVSAQELYRILFVGSQWYTKYYNKIFRDKDYYTIDINPKNKIYGSKKHIIDSLENIFQYFKEEELDLIICNGVWGWGLNDKALTEKAFTECFKCLRKGGIFLLGWDDIPEHRPFPLDECKSLKLFQPLVFKPLSASQYPTATPYRHTYNFYIK